MRMISFVVPIHNSAVYLDVLLGSFLGQTLKNFEIIFVDDHSDDHFKNTIEKYTKQLQITILPSDLAGPGAARNVGLAAACGDYVSFVDADDELDPDFVELMWAKATTTSADIVESLYRAVDPDGKFLSQSNIEQYLSKQDRVLAMMIGSFPRTVWAKLYKRQSLMARKALFPDGILNGEDHIFTALAYQDDPKISQVYKHLYIWKRHENSLTTRWADKKIVNDTINVKEWKYHFCREYIKNPSDFSLFANRCWKEFRVLTREIADSEAATQSEDLFLYFKKSLESRDWVQEIIDLARDDYKIVASDVLEGRCYREALLKSRFFNQKISSSGA